MTHKFDPANIGRLDNSKRRAILPPEIVLADIQLRNTDVWADIGCGVGYFSIPMAGNLKKVYSLDISDEMLTELKRRFSEQHIDNVEALLSEENAIPLPDKSVDGVLLALAAHELDNPNLFFRQITRILKPGGRLVVIEWVKAVMDMGPPLDHRLEPEQVDSWAEVVQLTKGRSWQWSGAFAGLEYIKGIDMEAN